MGNLCVIKTVYNSIVYTIISTLVTGIFTPSDNLAKEVVAASEAAGEKLWRLPMEESYCDSMKSGVADMVNTGGRQDGSKTAALFLKHAVYICMVLWSCFDRLELSPSIVKNVLLLGYLVYVTAGVYEEYVNIPKNKKYLMMIGDGINQTVITGNHSVVDGWTTFNSATFIVVSPYFVAVNITIRNTAGSIKHQDVALRNGADLSTFYSCSFEGYQDTLYTHSLRQFYRECDIYGTVDFIFGNAAAVFQNCNLYPRLPMSGQFNAITAQGRTDPGQNTGTSIQKCIFGLLMIWLRVTGTLTYLGRPWKEYSRTVYMQSYMDTLITPAGWSIWSGDFALNTSYYAEFNNSGPGSDTSRRVSWSYVINATDAANFTVSSFIAGDAFLPQTGVPYDSGL